MDNTPIERALANEPITITLAGLDFEFKEPGKKTRRILEASFYDIVSKYEDIIKKTQDAIGDEKDFTKVIIDYTFKDRAQELRYQNDVLEWVMNTIGIKKVQRKQIEDHASKEEIYAAYTAIFTVFNAPLFGGPQNTALPQTDTTP
jgi:hypothetical protein